MAATIENNVRKLIIDEQPINPMYYDKMSELLDALIERRKQNALDYEQYLVEIVALAKQVVNPATGAIYPDTMGTATLRTLYDNLGKNETLALDVDRAVRNNRQDDWRNNAGKIKKIKFAIKAVLSDDEELTEEILKLVKHQLDY